MISVVIPLYNKEKQIRNTFESVLNQTFQEFEIILVNDGSTDNSAQVVAEFKDLRIRIFNQSNQGVSAARNKGIREAKYDYIAFLDADDDWKPTYLESQFLLIQTYPQCSVFACAYEIKYANNTYPLLFRKILIQEKQGVLSNYFEVAAKSHPPLWTSSVVVRKEAILSIGGFPPNVIEGEDLIVWAKLALNYSIAYHRDAQAYFVKEQEKNYSNEMPRIHKEKIDLGAEFECLYKMNKNVIGLKDYVSHWYKMRTAMYLLSGARKKAWREGIKSLRYNILNVKVWVYLFLIPLPKTTSLKIFQKFGNA